MAGKTINWVSKGRRDIAWHNKSKKRRRQHGGGRKKEGNDNVKSSYNVKAVCNKRLTQSSEAGNASVLVCCLWFLISEAAALAGLTRLRSIIHGPRIFLAARI